MHHQLPMYHLASPAPLTAHASESSRIPHTRVGGVHHRLPQLQEGVGQHNGDVALQRGGGGGGARMQSRGEGRWKAGQALLEARPEGAEQYSKEAQTRALCTHTSNRWGDACVLQPAATRSTGTCMGHSCKWSAAAHLPLLRECLEPAGGHPRRQHLLQLPAPAAEGGRGGGDEACTSPE